MIQARFWFRSPAAQLTIIVNRISRDGSPEAVYGARVELLRLEKLTHPVVFASSLSPPCVDAKIDRMRQLLLIEARHSTARA